MGRSGENTGSLSRQFRRDLGLGDTGRRPKGHRRGVSERGIGENPVLSRLLFVEEGGT
jgi:hypothetical protein